MSKTANQQTLNMNTKGREDHKFLILVADGQQKRGPMQRELWEGRSQRGQYLQGPFRGFWELKLWWRDGNSRPIGAEMTVYCVLLHERKIGLSKLPGPILQVTLACGHNTFILYHSSDPSLCAIVAPGPPATWLCSHRSSCYFLCNPFPGQITISL